MKKEIIENVKTNYMRKNILYFEEIDSTQKKAKEIVSEIENGTIIIAENQTEGRGTHGRKWISEKGKNIMFTLVLFPNCNIEKIQGLTILIANCLVRAIENLYKIKLNIKYPNDLMCNNKKIGGILTESISQNSIVKKIFIGIGFNVNSKKLDKEIENIATSLCLEFDKEFSREKIISEFLNIFENEFKELIK